MDFRPIPSPLATPDVPFLAAPIMPAPLASPAWDRALPSPRLERVEDGLLCNGMLIPFARSPLTARLYATFLERPREALGRPELLQAIYGIDPDEASERKRASDRQNLVKLISRSRSDAEACVNAPGFAWIKWFPYDSITKKWTLYALTSLYVEARGDFAPSAWEAGPEGGSPPPAHAGGPRRQAGDARHDAWRH